MRQRLYPCDGIQTVFRVAPGRIEQVLVRDKRGHHDEALIRGRQWDQIAVNRVEVYRAPKRGEKLVVFADEAIERIAAGSVNVSTAPQVVDAPDTQAHVPRETAGQIAPISAHPVSVPDLPKPNSTIAAPDNRRTHESAAIVADLSSISIPEKSISNSIHADVEALKERLALAEATLIGVGQLAKALGGGDETP